MERVFINLKAKKWGVVLCLLLLPAEWGISAQTASNPSERQRSRLAETSVKLRNEVAQLKAKERGLLSELNRLDAEILLETNEAKRLTLEAEQVEQRILDIESEYKTLHGEAKALKDYLSLRLRALYKQGGARDLKRLVLDQEAEDYLQGWRLAQATSQRDSERLQTLKALNRELEERLQALERLQLQLTKSIEEKERAQTRLARSRQSRRAVLNRLREDRSVRESALREVQRASAALDALIQVGQSAPVDRSVNKFKGLLPWPTAGKLETTFGKKIHPKFKTQLPQLGWDIRAQAGTPILAVFDGTVRFASWLEGYGLTIILDHGEGVLSIYAHASAIQVEKGDQVISGDTLGRVGSTGSLKGAYLYFELRKDGTAVDPAQWLVAR